MIKKPATPSAPRVVTSTELSAPVADLPLIWCEAMDLQTISRTETLATDLATLKLNARIRAESENDLLTLILTASEEQFEADTNTALLPTSFKLGISRVLPTFQLPRPPFIELTSVKYTPLDMDEVTVDTSTLTLRYVEMLPTFTIPDLLEQSGSMEIVWKAGFADKDAVPARIKRAIYTLATYWAENRSAVHLDKRIMDVEKVSPLNYTRVVNSVRVKNADVLNRGY